MSGGTATLVVSDRPWEEALPAQAARLGIERAAVLCSPGRTALGERARRALGSRGAAVLGLARRHVPREAVREALSRLEALGADAVATIGGGSAVGLGKAVRLERDLAFLALPTTYAGSEMTAIYGVREGGEKRVGRDPRVRPDVVIYDPSLTLELPPETSAASLMNALAHAVDALYASGVTPEIAARAEAAIAALAAALRRVPEAPRDLEERRRAQRGAREAAEILASAGMALHHKLAHVVAGTLDLPHAETHAVLLPHVIAFNAGAAPRATEAIARALGDDDPAGALHDLASRASAPVRLDRFGFTREAAGRAAASLAAAEIDNPRRGSEEELAALLSDARLGRRPSVRGRR